jgi:1,4-dihydroxy-2-naphthoyl-CoA hydrolase
MSFNKESVLNQLNDVCKNTLMETLSIEYIDAGEDFLTAKMPVNSKVHQPAGILHGGATVALAESVGSAASRMVVQDGQQIRGIEIAANHLKSIKEGWVFATAKIVHKGRTTHLWEIRITDEKGQLISLCKLTNIVLSVK